MATTIKDVAKYAGVGIGTVSRVINNERGVGVATRKKVIDAMNSLNYLPNNMASQLRKNETKKILTELFEILFIFKPCHTPLKH